MELPTGATDIFFYIFSTLGVLFALGVVLNKNPIASAFSLVVVFFCVAANYALMHAHFIAAIQILVYAGAIMVLFVFVIMLLNADIKNLDLGKSKLFQGGSAVLCAALLAMFVWAAKNGTTAVTKGELSSEKIESLGGNVQVLSMIMFSDYVLPFELTSILLLVGIVGSVALAKRKLEQKQ
ncbi:MAG: NADH-quinone oxidoreductase subunit J [Bdellovibrionota bacterium]